MSYRIEYLESGVHEDTARLSKDVATRIRKAIENKLASQPGCGVISVFLEREVWRRIGTIFLYRRALDRGPCRSKHIPLIAFAVGTGTSSGRRQVGAGRPSHFAAVAFACTVLQNAPVHGQNVPKQKESHD